MIVLEDDKKNEIHFLLFLEILNDLEIENLPPYHAKEYVTPVNRHHYSLKILTVPFNSRMPLLSVLFARVQGAFAPAIKDVAIGRRQKLSLCTDNTTFIS